MVYLDFAKFKCPCCLRKILVTGMKGQTFAERLINPEYFCCPHCGRSIVFRGSSARFFKLGIFFAFFVTLPWVLLSEEVSVWQVGLFLFGIALICFGMLSQKLISVTEVDNE